MARFSVEIVRHYRRLLWIEVKGHMEFCGLIPQPGQGFGMQYDSRLCNSRPQVQYEKTSWECFKGEWQSVMHFEKLDINLKDDEICDLAIYQNLIDQTFCPGFEVRSGSGESGTINSQLAMHVAFENRQHFTGLV